MALAGLSKDEMINELKEVVREKAVLALEAGAMCYMMSRAAFLGDSVGHWHSHLMFYGPCSDGKDWGANFPGSPVIQNPWSRTSPEPLTTFMVVVDRWSDGTPAPMHGQRAMGS